jgi:enoyl-CoA hydratase/carnithine racemase
MDVLRTLATFEKPLIAAVHGPTVGIGVTMLLHCDLVVAAQGTQLIMPFVALGLVPEAGSSLLLPRLLGQQRAAELLLLGEPLAAAAAERLGLVNRVVEPDQLLDEARALAQRLVRQPAEALRATRRLLRGETAELRARIEAEAQVFGARLKSAEFLAQVRALLGKGRP